MIIERPDGMWALDHKTTSSLMTDNFLFDVDEQITSYVWALRELGYPIKGLIYQELLKAGPDLIKPMKSRRKGRILSVAKANNVNYKDFMAAIENFGEDVEDYTDYLEWLKLNPSPFFKRTDVYRGDKSIAYFREQLFYETVAMLDPFADHTVPSPGGACKYCPYKDPCSSMSEGGDWSFLLEELFIEKKRLDIFKEQ